MLKINNFYFEFLTDIQTGLEAVSLEIKRDRQTDIQTDRQA